MGQRRRVLFIDDEASIRQTLPPVLEGRGFEVVSVGTVPEAITAIGQSQFDILISDLNIGEPGDGFTVVSAMRRVQPQCKSFILTGYPDFESALRAIRNQVDDYLVKPTDPEELVATLEQKVDQQQRTPHGPLKETSQLLGELQSQISRWLIARLRAREEFSGLRLPDEEITEPVSLIVAELVRKVKTGTEDLTPQGLMSAAAYGTLRQQQGYSVAMLVAEGHILQHVISKGLQDNLLRLKLSTVIGDMIAIGEALNGYIEEAVRAFSRAALPHSA